MQLLQGIARSIGDVNSSAASEEFNRLGAALVQLKEKIREEIQTATAGDIAEILKKLKDNEPLSPQEKETVGLWVVGDAAGYTKMEDDYPEWLAEFQRLGGVLAAYEGKEDSPRNLVEAHGLLEDAIRVAADLAYFLEKKERVDRFAQAINNLTREDARYLVDILKAMLSRTDM